MWDNPIYFYYLYFNIVYVTIYFFRAAHYVIHIVIYSLDVILTLPYCPDVSIWTFISQNRYAFLPAGNVNSFPAHLSRTDASCRSKRWIPPRFHSIEYFGNARLSAKMRFLALFKAVFADNYVIRIKIFVLKYLFTFA